MEEENQERYEELKEKSAEVLRDSIEIVKEVTDEDDPNFGRYVQAVYETISLSALTSTLGEMGGEMTRSTWEEIEEMAEEKRRERLK